MCIWATPCTGRIRTGGRSSGDTLPDTVVADLRQNSAYWAAFEGPVNDAASKVYDSFLKSNGESRGVQSYGTVVDMLMAYYG